MKRFRIAFSFAGEKRDFVARVAAILAEQFGESAILYDEYCEAEFARYDLSIYLPKLYRDESDLVVAVLCPDYDQKAWTGWEWMAIHAQLTKNEGSKVMLTRFGGAHVDGLFEGAAFVELDAKTPEQTATLVLERLAFNEGLPKNHYTKPAAAAPVLKTSTPNNLPRLQPFFGREAELATIREALDPDSRTWGALIDGPGGMGKTSLAVRAAYDCPPGLFERIVFVSVKDRKIDAGGGRPLGNLLVPDFLAMLNELARELAQPDIAKSPEDQRIRLLLDALRPARTLLILDNLESLPKTDRDQLLSFVETLPQGCRAILTSRRRIGSDSEELFLEKLDENAALATLADLARRNRLLGRTSEAERIALYIQTAGNPLLLRWVAGQLGRGSCRTFTDALAFLRTCPSDNDPLEFIFGDLVNEFTDPETKVLCALTYFSLPAKVEHVAEVASLDEEPVETALRSLANRSLVVPDQEEKTLALVPMVADFLRRKRSVIVTETGVRLEKRAYTSIVENGFQRHDRFPILEQAWPIIAAALPLFIAGRNERLQEVCGALRFFLEFSGRWDEWRSLWPRAEEIAKYAGDARHAGKRAFQMGWFHYRHRRTSEVLQCADRAAAYWNIDSQRDPDSESSLTERASVMLMRGLSHRLKGDHERAIAAFSEALDLFTRLSRESVDVAICLNGIATAQRHARHFDEAKRLLEQALALAHRIKFREGIASYTSGLARLAIELENWSEAEDWARQALALSEALGRKELIARDCHRIAIALLRQNNPAEALPYARRAVGIYHWLGSPDLKFVQETLQECEEVLEVEAEDCLRLAKVLVRKGQKPEALPHARRAVEIFTALRSPDLEAARATLRECEG